MLGSVKPYTHNELAVRRLGNASLACCFVCLGQNFAMLLTAYTISGRVLVERCNEFPIAD